MITSVIFVGGWVDNVPNNGRYVFLNKNFGSNLVGSQPEIATLRVRNLSATRNRVAPSRFGSFG